MPETIKLSEHEGNSSELHESSPGEEDMTGHSDKVLPFDDEDLPHAMEKSEPSRRLEPSHGRPPGVSDDDDSLSEFAESVVSGLEQARLDEDVPEEFELGRDLDAVELPDGEQAFFAGWDGASLSDEPEPAEPEGEAAAPDYQSLSQMGLASAAAFYTEDDAAADSAAVKHDELADAVQSALLSVYGESSAPSVAASYEAPQFAPTEAATEETWSPYQQVSPAATSSDELSPQDVILNYFSYNSGDDSGSDRAAKGPTPYDAEIVSNPRLAPQAPTFYQSQHQSEWTADYKEPAFRPQAGFPVPATSPKPTVKPAPQNERESGRLLGAAAVGLVGGIAIAATLAVFVINSYGPDSRFGQGSANRKQDGTDAGYGRIPSGSGTETPRAAADTAPAEPSGAIAANDFAASVGQPVALPISIKVQRPLEQTLVSITGVPEGGRLNAGVDAGGGNWLLSPRRLNGLTITLPAGSPESVPLEVQLLDSNGRTPLSEKKRFAIRVNPAGETPIGAQSANQGPQLNAVIAPQPPKAEQAAIAQPSFNTRTLPAAPPPPVTAQPQPTETNFKTQTVVASPPQQQSVLQSQPAVTATPFQASLAPPAPPPNSWQESVNRKLSPQPEIEDLIREGNKRMREGDILEARQLYQRAVSLGDPEAALAMGRSFDPIYFARIDKKNAEPDAAKAFDWYRKAMDGGATQTAKVRIENLKHFLNE